LKSITFGILSHIVASVICLIIFTATPVILYGVIVVISAITNGDVGGLLNFILIPMFSVLLAIITTFVILLPITAVLQWLSSLMKLSKWIPLLGIFPVSLAVFTLVAFTVFKSENVSLTLLLLIIWCLIGSICFALYWIPLNLATNILYWLASIFGRFLPKKNQS
jgi:hypothetical protein